ncbi:hypothetical protein MKY34_08760 [Sporosarcina sp. FSL K6-1522]|uniref:hypothetical protein n=1 Tax=Sporosarcina sp. FSL K6-1522 TaxID=2921554 RepID=UPI00315A33EE
MQVMQALPIEQRRVRLALISVLFAEIKAPLFRRGDLSLCSSIIQPVFEHPLNRKTKPHPSRHLWRWEFSVADASLSVQKDLLNEDKLSNI